MPKWCSNGRRYLQIRISTYTSMALGLIAVIHLFGYYGYYNYTHIDRDAIDTMLYKKVQPAFLRKGRPNCTYENLLQSTRTTNTWDVLKDYNDFDARGIVNGSYVPEHCNPSFSVAILVTYRNRQKQLNIFLPYMHNFLKKQNIHYKIYLIEQQDEKPWNKGLLYNIGAKHAIAEKFPCLILQDVDLLPLDESNLYVCTSEPRHLSASIDKFRFVLPYYELVGGVAAIRSDHYEQLNGFSNKFLGWGGEDDDFSGRISRNFMNILRFPREMSRYTMLVHRPEVKNKSRRRIIEENIRAGALASAIDGLSSVKYRSVQIKERSWPPRDLFYRGIVSLEKSAFVNVYTLPE